MWPMKLLLTRLKKRVEGGKIKIWKNFREREFAIECELRKGPILNKLKKKASIKKTKYTNKTNKIKNIQNHKIELRGNKILIIKNFFSWENQWPNDC